MKFITLDLETFYSKEFSLSKMTTEQYIRSPEFEVIGVGVKVNDGVTEWASGTHEELKEYLHTFPWGDAMLIGQNTMFDGAILSWVFDVHPKALADTMCMSKAMDGVHISASLAKQAERHLDERKGGYVSDAIGKRRNDFTAQELADYGDYCIQDVDLTYALFRHYMREGFPPAELKVIDITLRMYTEPTLELDAEKLGEHLTTVARRKKELLDSVTATEKELMSNALFAEQLIKLGVEPPTKVSKKTGKVAFAFAKTDMDFQALQEHPDDEVQALVAARLGNKSTLEETRTNRFIGIASRGKLPGPISYYGAHTGRWSGTDKINLQNLPSRGKNGKMLKKTIKAPDGYMLVEADLSQIEARMVAWLAGQQDLVDAFARGEDVYKIMANRIYGVPIDEITDQQRFIGKGVILGCISEGTPVLCDKGWVNIEQVTHNDKLWEGGDWVCHQGLVPKGLKETQSLCGSWLTPDHEVLCGDKWVATESVVQNENMLSQALARGAESLPSWAMSRASEVGLKLSLSNVTVGSLNIQSTNITSNPLRLLGATSALKERVTTLGKSIGSMLTLSQTTVTALGYSTVSHRQFPDATIPTMFTTKITGGEGLRYHKSGVTTEPSSSNMLSHSRVGISQSLKWTAQTIAEDMKKATYGLLQGVKTCVTAGMLAPCKKKLMTYDIAYAGPNNRFTIWTEQGPVIVHNCGYGMGAARFKAQIGGMGVEIEESESKRIVQTYRSTYTKIKKLWYECNNTISAMETGRSLAYGRKGVMRVDGPNNRVYMPNNLSLIYPELQVSEMTDRGPQFAYKSRKGMEKIYGGLLTENTCQALAKLIIAEHMLRIGKKYRVALTVHDSVIAVVPEKKVIDASIEIYKCMKFVPDWAEGLPLDSELGYAKYYGDCDDNAKATTKLCVEAYNG